MIARILLSLLCATIAFAIMIKKSFNLMDQSIQNLNYLFIYLFIYFMTMVLQKPQTFI
jgi:hypothetical protein